MTAKTVHSKKGMEIIRHLSEEGKRIFTLEEANKFNKSSFTRSLLHYLAKESWIVRLKPGLYAIQMPGAQSLHEFEIAMSLVSPSVISHWSAMNYRGFTDQTPRKIFVTTTSNPPRY